MSRTTFVSPRPPIRARLRLWVHSHTLLLLLCGMVAGCVAGAMMWGW